MPTVNCGGPRAVGLQSRVESLLPPALPILAKGRHSDCLLQARMASCQRALYDLRTRGPNRGPERPGRAWLCGAPQARQAGGHWFEPSIAHPEKRTVAPLLADSASGWRSCEPSVGPFLGQTCVAPVDVGGHACGRDFGVDRVMHVLSGVIRLGVKIGRGSLSDGRAFNAAGSSPAGPRPQGARAWRVSKVGTFPIAGRRFESSRGHRTATTRALERSVGPRCFPTHHASGSTLGLPCYPRFTRFQSVCRRQ
jgi:hypothetical protein